MATKIHQPKPFIVFGPGDYILDFLEDLNWNAEQLANKTEISLSEIQALLQNRQPVTLFVAHRLAAAFGNSPEFWLQAQNNFNIHSVSNQPGF